jgi:uncharacterized membrane protein YeaQ/YmgE (transglycosylase-associated protein family)
MLAGCGVPAMSPDIVRPSRGNASGRPLRHAGRSANTLTERRFCRSVVPWARRLPRDAAVGSVSNAASPRWADRYELLHKGKRMNFLIWLVVGGVIGWIASMIMKTDAQQGMILNVVVGIVGSMLGGWLIAPLLGSATINQNDFSITGLIASLIGAVILLAIVNLVRRGRVR